MIIQDFDVKKVTLEEQYKSDAYETMTLYFIAPKEWLSDLYPDIVHTEISIEYPLNCPEASAATVMVSPQEISEIRTMRIMTGMTLNCLFLILKCYLGWQKHEYQSV